MTELFAGDRLDDVESRLDGWLASAKRENPVIAAVDRVNVDLPVIDKVRRIIIADEPFSIANEQMTPSMKNRRHAILAVYGERLDGLYKG